MSRLTALPPLAAKGAPGGAYLEVITSSVQHVDTCSPIRAGPGSTWGAASHRHDVVPGGTAREGMGPELTTTHEKQTHTTHAGLAAWVEQVAELTQPRDIHWITGSHEEWTELTDQLVEAGTFTRLDESKKPNSFYCACDPTDVARVEDRTYICSVDEKDAGPTNNWMAPGRDEGDR